MEHEALSLHSSSPARANLTRRPKRTAKFDAAATDVKKVESAARRFFLEGVNTPISATVESENEGGLVLSQALPFLSLNASLSDEFGVDGKLSDVSVMMVDGVPHLILDVATGKAVAVDKNDVCNASKSPTLSYFIESTRNARQTNDVSTSSKREQTIPFETRPFASLEDTPAPQKLGLRNIPKQTMALAPIRDVQVPAVDLWSKLRVFFGQTVSLARNFLTSFSR